MIRRKLKLLLVVGVLLFASIPNIYADEPAPSDNGNGADPPPATAPISSAVPALALLGLALVYKSYSKQRS